MKNLVLFSIILILVAGCVKEENENRPNVINLKGKWLSWDNQANSVRAVESSEWLEFGDSTFESVYN